jgi:hypothetical protein
VKSRQTPAHCHDAPDPDVPEFEVAGERAAAPRLQSEQVSVGVLTRGALRFRVHRVTDAGPYDGSAGRPICVLSSRRRARYLVLETRAGRLIVFNIGDRRGSYTPWNRSSRSPFGVIDRADLAAFASSLGLDGVGQ